MGRVALVTGASGGIGSAIARELGADHDVLIHYHSDRGGAEAVADDLTARGRDVLVHRCDVSDADAVADMVDRGRDELGSVDVLVNNAGVLHGAEFQSAAVETVRQTLRVNLEGAVYCARAVLPDMLQRGEGWIVNVASTAGISGSPSDVAYGTSKSGLLGLTRSLAKQYTDDGIFANAVAPGPTDTKMYAKDRRPAARERSPIDRLVAPEEVAETVRLFATTSAVAGEVLTVDGGVSL